MIFTLANIGSIMFTADASEGSLDLYAISSLPGPRQLGVSLRFEDLEHFERAVALALKATKPKRRAKRKRGGG